MCRTYSIYTFLYIIHTFLYNTLIYIYIYDTNVNRFTSTVFGTLHSNRTVEVLLNKQTVPVSDCWHLSPGYTRDWLPAYSFVLRARAMVLTGQCTLSDTSGARQ